MQYVQQHMTLAKFKKQKHSLFALSLYLFVSSIVFLEGIGDSRRMSIRIMQYDGTRNLSAVSSPSLKMSLTRFLLTSPVGDCDKCAHAEYALPSKLQAKF